MEDEIFTSKTALSNLEPTTLSQLRFEKVAKGKYIMVKVIKKCGFDFTNFCAWETEIEDREGRCVCFVFFNYPSDEIIFLADVLIIKEPLYRVPPNSQDPILQCYSPTDIIVLRPSHPWFPRVKLMKWRSKVPSSESLFYLLCSTNLTDCLNLAKPLLARCELALAREVYKLGLKLFSSKDEISKTITRNLLKVQLRLGYFEWVVKYGEAFLRKFPDQHLAYLSLGEAYYSLRNYGKALETYHKLRERFGEDPNYLTKLDSVIKERIRQANGEFNFENLRKMSLENPIKEIDCVDFSDPVKVMKVPGKGRGLVLTKDVSEGSVLVVSKALAVVLSRELAGEDIANRKFQDFCFCLSSLVGQLTQLIMKNPKTFGTRVYDLFSGINSTEPVQLFCDPEKNEPIVHLDLLLQIIGFNLIWIGNAAQNERREFRACGLFLVPSYMNHSCVPNTVTEFYNDVMVVKALEDMEEGTELTRSYLPPEKCFEKRTKYFEQKKFKCDCAKCQLRL